MPDTWTEQEVLGRIDKIRRRKPTRVRDDFINMSHGAGGKATHTLIQALFEPILHNPLLEQLGDQAIFSVDGLTLALTTDSYVVSPIIFPGGDIGELAVNGTINDLAVGGATPLYLSAAVILEEGLDIPTLTRIVESMRRAADEAGVAIVTGDTKVVPKGKGDRIFINTTGLGVVRQPGRLGVDKVRVGDAVLVSGTVGDRGTAVLIARGDLNLEVELESDTAPLHTLVDAMLEAGDVHFMRDATRGGVADLELRGVSTVSGRLSSSPNCAYAEREECHEDRIQRLEVRSRLFRALATREECDTRHGGWDCKAEAAQGELNHLFDAGLFRTSLAGEDHVGLQHHLFEVHPLLGGGRRGRPRAAGTV